MIPRWDILICSVYARTPELVGLLRQLTNQARPYDGQVRIVVDRDDCETPVGVKRTRLVEASDADYVCFIDDDDEISVVYVSEICRALASRPDYVGFRVAYSVDEVWQKNAVHSLEYPVWFEDDRGYYRGITHLNPIRRDAALAGLPFLPGFGEDRDWADRVRGTGMVQRQVFIDRPLYHYRYSRSGSLFAGGARSLGFDPGLPAMQNVRVLQETPCI